MKLKFWRRFAFALYARVVYQGMASSVSTLDGENKTVEETTEESFLQKIQAKFGDGQYVLYFSFIKCLNPLLFAESLELASTEIKIKSAAIRRR